MPFPVEVDCQPAPGGEPEPRVLRVGGASVAVTAVVDRWSGRDHRYFKLVGEDGATYIVRHDLPADVWELAFYDSGKAPAR